MMQESVILIKSFFWKDDRHIWVNFKPYLSKYNRRTKQSLFSRELIIKDR